MFSKCMYLEECETDSSCRATCLHTYLAPVEYLSTAASLKNVGRLLHVRPAVIWSRGGADKADTCFHAVEKGA